MHRNIVHLMTGAARAIREPALPLARTADARSLIASPMFKRRLEVSATPNELFVITSASYQKIYDDGLSVRPFYL